MSARRPSARARDGSTRALPFEVPAAAPASAPAAERTPGTGEPWRIHIDGASRGNPGEAAFGVHVADAAGTTVAELHGYLGRATNNVAEYQALLHALRFALRHGVRRVELASDSELVVRQMRGEYRVKHPDMQVLHAQARELWRRFEQAVLRHVPRAQNTAADRLANLALDQRQPAPADDEQASDRVGALRPTSRRS